MSKAAEAFRTIGEVADELDVPKHVLRFWEGKFPQIRPMKRGGGRRYYRPEDMELLRGIRHLLHAEGYTIKGVQKILREAGVDEVKALARAAVAASAADKSAGGRKRGRKPRDQVGGLRAGMQPVAGGAPAVATPGSAGKPIEATVVLRQVIGELEQARSILVGGQRPAASVSGDSRARPARA